MAFSHGTIATLDVDPLGGTSWTSITAYMQDIDDDINVAFLDTTTLGKTAKVGIPGLEDGKFKMKGLWDTTVDGVLDNCKRKVISFRYRPAGAGSGLAEYTGKAILTSYTLDTSVKGAASFKAELTVSDGHTRAVQS